MNIKLNDVFRWRYSDKKLRELNHGNNGGITYWCVSQIAVVELVWDELVYADTYWRGSEKHLVKEWIESGDIILEYVGNLDDWTRIDSDDAAKYYEDKDIIDIRCANNSAYGVYVKKGTKKSINKIKEVMEYNIKKMEGDIKYKERRVKEMKKELAELTEENIDKVYIN